ncbi:Hypothetical protein in type-1 retrotransposable element R1DM, partial [Stegodyphus mimosarum]
MKSTTEDTIREIMRFHFPEDDTNQDSTYHADIRAQSTEIGSKDDQPFTLEEMQRTINSTCRGKAPGLDGLIIETIKELRLEDDKQILTLFNKCLQLGYFPKKWENAELVLFQKEGKAKSMPSSYRPICLLSARSKVLDKMFTQRLTYYLVKNKLLNPAQYGFTKGRSTTDALNRVQDIILNNRQNNLHTCIISLDVTSAFNKLWWPALKTKLKDLRCPKNLYQLITSYLTERQVTYKRDALNIMMNYHKGAPQGCNIGPDLWNIIANSALNINFGENHKIQAYADDIILIIDGGNRTTIERKGGAALKLLTKWSQDNKLCFSIEKTQMIVFPKGSKIDANPPRIKWEGHPLRRQDIIKYLGFTLDKKLTWVSHLTEVRDKTHGIINKLNSIITDKWSPKGRLLKHLNLNAIERMILYGCPVWMTGTARICQKLQQIQRVILLKITSAYSTTSTAALRVLDGTLPLGLKAGLERSIYRLLHYKENLHIKEDLHLSYANIESFQDPPVLHPGDQPILPCLQTTSKENSSKIVVKFTGISVIHFTPIDYLAVIKKCP